MSRMVRLAAAIAAWVFCNIAVAQFLPEDQIPLEIQNQIIAEVVAEHGHLDMAALEVAFRDWLLSQPLPDADGQMLDADTCSNCSPPTDGENPIFPSVRDVEIITREGRIRPSFKVKWRRPERLPREIRDLYELNSYEVFLVRDDGTYEHHEITKTLRADGTEQLKRRIRFRRRDPGFYTVHVRPVYVEVQQTQAASEAPVDGKLAVTAAAAAKLGQPVTRSGAGGLKGGWGGGGGAPLDPETTTVATAIPDSNDPLRRCIEDRVHFEFFGGTAGITHDYTSSTIIGDIPVLQCNFLAGTSIISDITALSDFSDLRVLNLHGQSVDEIGSIRSLADLEELDISHTSISQAELDSELGQLDDLKIFKADSLGLTEMPPITSSFMLTLSLANNNINDSGFCSNVTPSTTLGFMDLSSNGLNQNALWILEQFSISSLDLSHNSISTMIAPNCSASIFDTVSLDLSHNSTLSSFGGSQLSGFSYFSLNLSHTGIASVSTSFPEVLGQLILNDISSLASLTGSLAALPQSAPTQILWDGTDNFSCVDHEELNEWWNETAVARYANGTLPNGDLIDPSALLLTPWYQRPDSCYPDDVDEFTVIRDSNTHAHYLQWDSLPLESQFRDFSYEIQTRPAGTILPQGTPYVINNQTGTAVIGNLAIDTAYEFRIRRCLGGACTDYKNSWVGTDYPLTNPVGITVTWIDPIAGTYDLRWSYPHNYFVDNPPHHFKVELPGQPPVVLQENTNNTFQSFWQESSLQFTTPGILRISACDSADECATPASYMLSAEPVFDQTLEAPNSVTLEEAPGGDATRFSVEISANAFEHMQDEIDYFEISESGATGGESFTYFHDISDSRSATEHSIPVRRLSPGNYSVSVRACRRNRLSPNGDACSVSISVPAGDEHEINTDDVAIGYDTIDDTLCWREVVPDAVYELEWTYTPVDLPGQNFLIPDQYKVINQFNPAIDPIVVPFTGTNRFTIDSSNAVVGFDTVWNIQACDSSLEGCQGVGGVTLTDTAQQCGSPPAPLPETSGGPESLNPGVYLDESVFPRQGFTFYWASDLRHENTHEEYGNTYDLYVYWQTYKYNGGNWTPIWLYGELTNIDSDDPNVFDGGLYLPQNDLTQAHDMEAGHMYLTFGNDTSSAEVDVTLHLDGGMHTEGDRVLGNLTQLSNITQLLPPNDENGNSSTPNITDYNNGVWYHTEGNAEDYKILSWQHNYFEGQILLAFDEQQPVAQPIWFNGRLDCRTDTTGSCIGNGAPITRHPDPDNATIEFVTVSQGVPPFNATQEEIDAVVSVDAGSMSRTVPLNALPGTTPQGLIFNGELDVTLIDGNQNVRTFNLDTAGQDHLLEKEASLHDIRYSVDGVEHETNCTMVDGVCEIRLSWFSDDDFFNNATASVFPYYTLNGGTLQPLDNQLCNTGEPEVDFVVEEYVCQIRAPGTYRFYLRNRIGIPSQENTIARSASELFVDGGNNAANAPLTIIPDSLDVFFPNRNGDNDFDPGFEADGETFIDLPLPDATSESFGHTQGNFVVDSNGAANYTIPIMTAPGSGGLVPNVALSYNSQNGYGPMGKGWSVGGYSVISRCPQTFEQDGSTTIQNNLEYVPGVTFTDTDRFCLDGQRLMLVNEADTYGADGVLYRSELDSITVAKSVGSYGGAPRCFEVYRPDGGKEFYGDCLTGNSQDDSSLIKLNLDTEDRAYAWARASLEDNSGNYIRYEYQTRPANSQEVAIYIDKIHYTGNHLNSQAPYATVDFTYETKLATEQRVSALPDPRASIDDGSHSHLSSILKMVDDQRITSVTSTVDGLMLRQYQLSYTTLQGRKYLSGIQECNGATCYDATTFEWSGQANNIPAINTSGPTAFPLPDEIMDGIDATPLRATPADMNGDGLEDLLIDYRDSNGADVTKLAISQGNGQFTVTNPTFNTSPSKGLGVYDLNADGFTRIEDNEVILLNNALSDLNGDGLIDIAGRSGDDLLQFTYNTTGPGDTSAQFAAPVNAMVTITFDITGEGSPIGDPELDQVISVVDINQDGIAEIIMRLQQEFCEGDGCDLISQPLSDLTTPQPLTFVEESVGGEQGLNEEICQETCITESSGIGIAWLREDASGIPYYEINELGGQPYLNAFFTDFEGDGVLELCATNNPNGVRNDYICEGALFDGSLQPAGLEQDSSFTFQDINNDGYQDLLTTDNDSSNSTWQAHYATWNNGVLSFNSTAVNTGLIAGIEKQNNAEESDIRVFMDYTGDGILDYVFIEYDGSNGFNVFSSSAHDLVDPSRFEYLITDIHNGRGGSPTAVDGEHWSIEYLPMSDVEVYTRDNNAINAWFGSGKTAVYDMITSMPLVSVVKHEMPAWDLPAGLSGSLSYLGNWQDETRYHYRGLKMQAGGRGVLGFREVDSFDVDRSLLSQTRYRQDFPYIGRAYETQTWFVTNGAIDPWTVNESITNPTVPCWDSGSACLAVIPADNACVTDTGYQCSADTSVIVEDSHQLLDHSEMQYVERQSVSTNTNITFAFAKRELTQSFDLLSGNLLGRTVTVTEFNEAVDTFYGNPTDSTVFTYQGLDSGGNWLLREADDRGYNTSLSLINLNSGQWITNRVDNRQMNYQRPGEGSRSYFYYYSYDSRGRLTQEQKQDTPTSPLITLTTGYSNFDVFGNASQVTVSGTGISPNRESSFVFDSRGRYLQQRSQSIDGGNVLQLQVEARNRYGEPLKALNQQGIRTYIAYDAMGKAYYSYTDTGQWQQTLYSHNTSCYSGSAFAMTVTSGHGPDQTTCFDELGRPLLAQTTSLDGQLSKIVTQYDADGLVLAQSRPNFSTPANNVNGYWTKTIYDELDRPLQMRVPDGGISNYSYDDLDVVYTNAEGYTRTESNNILGERTGYIDYPDGQGNSPNVSFAFDAKGNVKQITGPMGDTGSYTITMTYNKFDYLTQTNDPSRGGAWDYQVNALGEQTCVTDPKDQSTKLSYDAFGRITFRHFYTDVTNNSCSGSGTFVGMHEWMYENTSGLPSTGQLIQSVSAQHMVTHTYDVLGRLVTSDTDIDGQVFDQDYRYDEFSRPLYQVDASGRGISFGYENGYLKTTSDMGTQRTYQITNALSPWGSIAQQSYESGQVMNRSYDDLGRVTSILTTKAGDDPVQNLTYTYDLLGNLKTRDDAGMSGTPFTETFFYDGLNRLDDVQISINGQQASDTLDITYDLSGRITQKDGVTYSYGNGQVMHGMTSMSDGYIAVYDDNGNQEQSGQNGDRYSTYTVFNKPSRIENLQAVVEFDYGAELSRFRRIDSLPDGTIQRETLYVGNVEVITESPDSQNPVTTYKRYIGDTVVVTESDTNHRVEYTHKDHLGSLHAITEVNGNLVSQLSFGAFGERRDHIDLSIIREDNPAANTTTRGYTGHEHVDSLNLVHMNARTYDASIGQMMQADSVIPDMNNSQSLNRFAYVYNNPLSYTDPTGNTPTNDNVNPRVRLAAIRKQARSGDMKAVQALGAIQSSGGTVRSVQQSSQGDSRSKQISVGVSRGLHAANFENNVSRQDSAEDEGAIEFSEGNGRKNESLLSKAIAVREELREFEEFRELEKESGELPITTDDSEPTSFDPNTMIININSQTLTREFKTKMPAGFEEGLAELSDEEYFEALDSYPQWYGFTLERIIFHETVHATQDDNSLIDLGQREIDAIDKTNEFMRKHFGEPFRLDHRTTRMKGDQ